MTLEVFDLCELPFAKRAFVTFLTVGHSAMTDGYRPKTEMKTLRRLYGVDENSIMCYHF